MLSVIRAEAIWLAMSNPVRAEDVLLELAGGGVDQSAPSRNVHQIGYGRY